MAEYVTAEGKRLLRQGGSLCWLLNNCGNLAAPMKDPALKVHIPGPEGSTAESNIYTDTLGRIKVQFPWDRYGTHNHNSSCWVRVSSEWAGNQLGGMHLPRVGQEVVVSFLGGDIDRPLCTGRIYNQNNQPPGNCPSNKP